MYGNRKYSVPSENNSLLQLYERGTLVDGHFFLFSYGNIPSFSIRPLLGINFVYFIHIVCGIIMTSFRIKSNCGHSFSIYIYQIIRSCIINIYCTDIRSNVEYTYENLFPCDILMYRSRNGHCKR